MDPGIEELSFACFNHTNVWLKQTFNACRKGKNGGEVEKSIRKNTPEFRNGFISNGRWKDETGGSVRGGNGLVVSKSDGGTISNHKQNISLHVKNIFAERELDFDSAVKDYLTTAADGKEYATH